MFSSFLSQKKWLFSVLAGMTLICMGAGCASSSSQSAQKTVDNSIGKAPATESAGLCDHPYYPLRSGYKATFKTQSPGKTSTYTMSVKNAQDKQINLNIAFENGLTATQSFDCSDGDLRATGYVDFASAAAGQRFTVETKRAEGVVIPRDVHVGSDWQTKFDIVMHSTPAVPAQPGMGDITGSVLVHHQVLGEESVTVPAGTFTALKVQTATTLQFSMPGLPQNLGNNQPVKSTEWWVRGKGLVKTVTGSQGTIVSEATEIVAP